MGLGIIEPKTTYNVVGTETLCVEDSDNLVLIPQPSKCRHDPLNWPLWRRDCHFAVLCYLTCVAASLAPLLATSSLVLLMDLEQDFTHIALLTGDFLLGMSVGGMVLSAWGRVFGKRLLYISCTVLMIGASCWTARSSNYTLFAWSRVIQGVSTVPFEVLVPLSISDMYHVHQRGSRMAVFSLCLIGVSFFAPIPAGAITDDPRLGWRWMFWLVAIFAAPGLCAVVLFCPETTFAQDSATALIEEKQLTVETFQPSSKLSIGESCKLGHVSYLEWKNWKLFLSLLVRPFAILLTPHVIWAISTQGVILCWTVTLSTVIGAIFGGMGQFLGPRDLGVIYVGPFVGSVVGFLLAALVSDYAVKKLTLRNGGTYEPEFRMVLLIPQLIFGAIGLFGFGNSVVQHDSNAIPSMFYGFVTAATVMGSVCAGTYILDAFRSINEEIFVCMLLFRGFATYGVTTTSFSWITNSGVDRVCNIIGIIQVSVTILTIMFYFFGKVNRAYFTRHSLFSLMS